MATCEREGGGPLAPAQLYLLARLPDASLELIASGIATLASVEADAARELAASWSDEDVEPTHEEEEAEAKALDARLKLLLLSAPAASQPVVTFVQRRRTPRGDCEPSVRWEWRTTEEGGAWYAEADPQLPARDHLRVAFISDTHGCHGLLQHYWDNLEPLRTVDVPLLCGDCWEHEGTPEERGPSILDDLDPQPSRDLAEWLLSLGVKYVICISGNHDEPFIHSETAALRGAKAPEAGAPDRNYMACRSCPCLYIQDENAVIPLGDGRELIIHGTPWQTDIGGLFQYSLGALNTTGFATGRPWSKDFGGLYSTDMDGNVSEWLEGDWGVGERAHIVISHGPPKYILDTVNGGFATSAGPAPKGRGPAGCNLLLGKLRRVKPLVAAWGHVHAEQGMAWLKWKTTKAFKDWRKAGKEALERGAPYPDPPPSAPRRASLRAVHGRDLSQVHASILPYDDP